MLHFVPPQPDYVVRLQSVCQDDIDHVIHDLSQRTAAVEAAAAAADNSTVALFNATQRPLRDFASTLARSSSFVTCAKRYSLSWWAWVLQLASLIATPIALTGGRLPAMGLPLLLATTALLVMQTEVCTRSLGIRSYGPAGQVRNGAACQRALLHGCCNWLYRLLRAAPAAAGAAGTLAVHQRGAIRPQWPSTLPRPSSTSSIHRHTHYTLPHRVARPKCRRAAGPAPCWRASSWLPPPAGCCSSACRSSCGRGNRGGSIWKRCPRRFSCEGAGYELRSPRQAAALGNGCSAVACGIQHKRWCCLFAPAAAQRCSMHGQVIQQPGCTQTLSMSWASVPHLNRGMQGWLQEAVPPTGGSMLHPAGRELMDPREPAGSIFRRSNTT